jgi:deazaflavin-dependent oxidoreductase (nitroreductase family)
MRAGDRRVIDQKRRGNRSGANPRVISIGRAGKRGSLFALIEHEGRKSGKKFITPVRLVMRDSTFLIPLAYGETCDWYRNLLAKGEMGLTWQGAAYRVGKPEKLAVAEGMRYFPLISRFLFRLDGLPAFVNVTIL